MHKCISIFCGNYACIFGRCCKHHACAGVYVRQVLWTSAYTFAYTLATGCAYSLMYVQFVHLALGNDDGGVLWKHLLLVCVSSIFSAGGSVCGCMRVYTHTSQMGYSVVSPRVGMRHLEGRKNPHRPKRSIHVDCIGVQSTFVYIYAGLRV